MTSSGVSRSRSLDILRLVAVLLVLGRHLEPFPIVFGKNLTFYVTRLWQNGGWTGVDLFFVLSGYLIGGLLFAEVNRTGGLRASRFLLRRGLKIYPAFYVFLATMLAAYAVRHVPMRSLSIVAECLFLQNYLGGLWNHTWSLAVEEHFYFSLPAVLLLLLRLRREGNDPFRVMPLLVASVAAVCLTLRIALARTLPFDNLVHLFPTHLRIDSLLIGVGVAYAVHFHRDALLAWRKRWLPFLLLGPLAFLPAFCYPLGSRWWLHSIALTAFAAGAAAIMIALFEVEPPPFPIVRFAAYLGSHSYSVYLWHTVIGILALGIRSRLPPTAAAWYLYAIVYVISAFAAGLLMAAAIEFPLLRIRDRLAPRAASPLRMPQ